MAGVSVFLGAVFVALFVYGFVELRRLDPVILMYVVGATLTARVFWNRAKNCAATVGEPKEK